MPNLDCLDQKVTMLDQKINDFMGLVTSMQIVKNSQLIAKAQDNVIFTEFENFQCWFKDVWFKQFPQQK